ncbi:hypothetical protein [Streptomyces sp. NPDC052107]|uniref:hypothetical protein n=1 Tax=Streptomyces sp. NPDC052107 TaxID=3155632 RepID=UPI003441CAF1
MRSQDEAWGVLRDQALRQWATLRNAPAPAFTVGDLDRLLNGLDAWRGLSNAQRVEAADLLGEAYESAATDATAEAPEELVEGFEETARAFVSSDAGFLPPKVQRALFVYFCGCLVLVALMQASFTSEAVDAVIGKTMDYLPAAGAAMYAAGKAFDRYAGHHSDNEDDADR